MVKNQTASEERRLTTIMFTDIVGYTAIMGSKEKTALQLLEKNIHLHNSEVSNFHGTILKIIGDGILVCFPSASEAIYCARALIKASEKITNLSLRIGIHEGEVTFKEGEVYGDGVNIASRIVNLAGKDEILISESIYQHIRNKDDIFTTSIGKEHLKNVDHPVSIYQVFETKHDRKISSHAASRRSRQLKKTGLYTFLLFLVIAAGIFLYKNNPNPESTADKTMATESLPRVAVLPLENLSNDPEQEYFCFGLAEEILNQLQKIGGLVVRSRTTSFQYKDTDKTLPDIAKELDVEFLLEGSVFKIGDSIRIVLQLINGLTDNHIWVETYKEDYGKILSILSNIPIEVANALKAEVIPETELQISRIPTNNITAYDYYLKGLSSSNNFWYSESEYDFQNAVNDFKSAIKLDDSFAAAYAHLAQVYKFYLSYTKYAEINLNWTDSVLALCNKAIQLDPNLALAYSNMAEIYYKLNETKKAERAFKKLADLQPNDRESVWPLAFYYNEQGQYIESLKLFNRLKNLGHTFGLPAVYCIFGQTYLSAGDLINAREAYSESLRIRPDFGAGFRDVAQFEFAKGNFQEALKN